ncbi:MAG: hypothetical protein HUU47_06490 [Bacteroidetes bacterium]|nr:hypothetical protein [Bacteroidota bacterium]
MKANNIIIKITTIAVFAVALNYFYTFTFWRKELKNEAPDLLKLQRIADSCDILYFGESSNISYNPLTDTIKTSISGLIAEKLDGKILGDITHEAYHAGIYLPLIKRISNKNKVKSIIVTLNLRTLGPPCVHSGLESALQKQALYYRNLPPLIIHLWAALNNYDNQTEYERDYNLWKQWANDKLEVKGIDFNYLTVKQWCEAEKFRLPDGTENMEKRTLADHYVKAYGFVLNERNVRINDLDNIVNHCKNKKIKLFFNLLAENTQYADSLAGHTLVELMRYNRDYLMKKYNNMYVTTIDNLEKVEGKDYTDQNWTTEHYNYKGRNAIAANVALIVNSKVH